MLLRYCPRIIACLVPVLVALGLLLPRGGLAETVQPETVQSETAAESRATAVRELVLDLLSYTRWPAEPAVLRMCVAAPTEYAGHLFTINRQANGRRVQVNRYEANDPAISSNCDVLYLGVLDEPTRIALFARLQGHPVLSISEYNHDCTSSSVFCLQTSQDQERIRFKVNLDALALSGVKVHPAVLKLAHAGQEAP
ncbi:hypothetical protein CK911_05180 [Aeromonas sp. CU5]|uniref:YfiR family protein n=1 Tax=Aeromonas sp. CU5 TaxID=2033033 RepID=UPI000BFC2DC2|nr:YfiR family protein [Aeromonas sp. CU5]ATL92263.1 hypothetical protein CK911_05180 [Aeromonas sp. CU5]